MDKIIETILNPQTISLIALIGTGVGWLLTYRKRAVEANKIEAEASDTTVTVSQKQMREWERLSDEMRERLDKSNTQLEESTLEILTLKNRVAELELHIERTDRETEKKLDEMTSTISSLKAQNTRLHNNLRRVVKQLMAIDNTVVPDVDKDLLIER